MTLCLNINYKATVNFSVVAKKFRFVVVILFIYLFFLLATFLLVNYVLMNNLYKNFSLLHSNSRSYRNKAFLF